MKRKTDLFFAFILCVSPAAAQQVTTLEEAIRDAWGSNPLLKAQKTQSDLANDDTWRRFFPQEPQLTYTNSDNNAENSWDLSLTYELPFKSIAYNSLDVATAEQQRYELLAKKGDLAAAVAQAYTGCATAQAMIEFQKKNVQDLETIAEELRMQYIHGQSNQTNKITAELTLTQAERDLRTARDQLITSVHLYYKLLKLSPDTKVIFELPEDVPPAIIKELGALGNRNNSQLRDQASVDVGRANRGLGFWSQVPDVNLSFGPNYWNNLNASASGLPQDYTFSIGFTIPILFPIHEIAEWDRTASAGVISEETSRLQLIQDNSIHDDAVRDYLRSRLRFKQLEGRDLVLATTMLEGALAAYKRGNLEFANLMLARQTYASLKIEDIQIRSEIVNAHLLCLGDAVEQSEEDTVPESSMGTETGVPVSVIGSTPPVPTDENPASTPTPVLRHRLGAKDLPQEGSAFSPKETEQPVELSATPETGAMPQTNDGNPLDTNTPTPLLPNSPSVTGEGDGAKKGQ